MSEPHGVLFACPGRGVGRPLAARLRDRGERVFERAWFAEADLAGETPAAALLEIPLFDGSPNLVQVAEWVWRWLAVLPKETRVVLVSSALVYGLPLRQPILEVDPLLPVDGAGLKAVLAEMVLLQALRRKERQGAGVRLGEIGPGGEQEGSWMDLGMKTGKLAAPPGTKELAVLGLDPALRALEALLAPQGLPLPGPAQVYHLAAHPRPAAMVIEELKHLTGQGDMTLVEQTNLPIPAAWNLNTAAARGHLGLPHALGRLLPGGGQEIS